MLKNNKNILLERTQCPVFLNNSPWASLLATGDFSPATWSPKRAKQAVALFSRLGINTIMLDPSQTELGGVETRQDAKICAELFRTHRDKIHGVVVLLPNFGDEKAIAETLRLSGLNVPVLIQAEEDNLDKMGLSTRRDSFCGKISLCNNLRQYGIPFTLTTQHVCALSGEVFEQDLRRFKQICRVVNSMRGVRVGAIGARPAGFNTVRYSEKTARTFRHRSGNVRSIRGIYPD
ncbi:putative L-fucose isomerase, C-terminal [Klebsiella pneumoniae]|nr:putative L-fucose isomerase, C-terminal [Klebsiella pneumoniae]